VAFGIVGIGCILEPATASEMLGQTPGIVAIFNRAWQVIGALLLMLALTSAGNAARRIGRLRSRLAVLLPGDQHALGALRYVQPFAYIVLALTIAQLVLLSVLTYIATLISPARDGQPIVYINGPDLQAPAGQP
jgi:hypothetical protein